MKKTIIHLHIFAVLCFFAAGNIFAQYNFNYAASFNGSSSYIAVPNAAGVSPSSAVTIEAWIYPVSYNNFPAILTKNYKTSYALFLNTSGKIRFYPKGGIGVAFEGNTAVPLNRWSHVAATYDGSSTKLYIDGNLDASSSSITGAIGSNTDSAYIGCDRESTGPTYFFSGYIDELRLWSNAKTQADIQRDMYVPLGTISAGGIYGGILSAWRFNNNAVDEGGNTFNNGFERNMTYIDFRQKPVNYVDYNGALALNGTTDYCSSIAFETSYSSPNAITLESWIKRDTTGTQPVNENIINRSGGTTRYNYAMFITPSGSLIFQINDGAFTLSSASGIITLGQWYHAAASYNSANGRAVLYINGDSVATTIFSGNPLINDNPDDIYIGGIGASNFSGNKFKGMIDEVRIWKNIVRTSAEIKANMYSNLNFTSPSLPAGLIDFGFDGMNYNTRTAPGSVAEYVFFFGGAYISSSHQQNDATPTSPILRDDAGGFSSGNYFTGTKRFFIPDNNSAGIKDSVFVSTGGLISNLKVFALINHTRVSDMTVTLTGPTGISANIFTNSGGSSSNDIMAIFSDAADSTPGSLSSGGFRAPFSPIVKPNSPLSVFNNTNRQGWWKIKIVDNAAGDIGYVNGWGILPNIITGINGNTEIPYRFALAQNYPNPFNPVTKIKYELAKDVKVKITVYNILGEVIETAVNEFKRAGSYEISFDGTSLSSGIYFYKIEADDFIETRKMILLK